VTTILVAVAGKHGATADIAGEIAGVLRRELPAADVEVRDAADPGELGRFDAVLVGSAIYLGRWLPAARHLVERHRAQLAAVPVWMFSSGPLGDPPGAIDDLTEVTALGSTVAARGHRVFAGRLDLADLRWTERLAVRAVHSPTGDFRDHDAIRAWAVEVAADLARLQSTPTDPARNAP
jgi:menaquinone-dependent protoporphyrinogen oxidase